MKEPILHSTTTELRNTVIRIQHALEGGMLCAIPLTPDEYYKCKLNCKVEQMDYWSWGGDSQPPTFMGIPVVIVRPRGA